MTPLAGFILAIVAGCSVPRARAARWIVTPWLAVLAVQTGALAAGTGHNPASTVTHFPQAIGYYVVQGFSLALAIWVAVRVAALRANRRPGPQGAPDRSLRRSTLIATVTSAVVSIAYVVATAPAHPGGGDGSAPLLGVAGLVACLATGATLSVRLRLEHRSQSTGLAGSAS